MKKNAAGIVFFDLDGTLLDNRVNKVPESSRTALKKLRENGYIIVLSTGRDMDAYYSSLYLPMIGPDAIIHLNGSKISVGGELLFKHTVDRGLLREVYEFCSKENICVGASIGKEDFYVNPELKTIADRAYNRFIARNFKPFTDIFERDIEIFALSFAGDIKTAGRKFEEHFPTLHLYPFSSDVGADIVEDGFSKAEGMKKLCEHYGIGIDKSTAFGDSSNDVQILKAAHLGIAMGNADERARAAADYVTDNIECDGIYNACVRFGMI